MKFIVLGTSGFTIQCAAAISDSGGEVVALLSMPAEMLPDNPADIRGFATGRGIEYHEVRDINSPASVALLDSYRADYIFSSWPRIIGEEVLRVPKYFTIGTHPTDLPHNRGRHPLHWLIVLGIESSKLSFFKMDAGIDSGNILLQEPFHVNDEDTINTLLQRVNEAAHAGTSKLVGLLKNRPDFDGEVQNTTQANYWRRRTPHDIVVDPRMSAAMIIRTVNSFAPPYPAAIIIVDKHVIRISHADTLEPDGSFFTNMEHGRVMEMSGNRIALKVEDGVVVLTTAGQIPDELKNTKYIFPPLRYICRNPSLISQIESGQ